MVFKLSRVPELEVDVPLLGVVGEFVPGAAEEALVGVGGDDPLLFTVRPEAAEALVGVLGEELVFAVAAGGFEAVALVLVAGGFEATLVGVLGEEPVVVGGATEGSVLIVSEDPVPPEGLVGSVVLLPEVPVAAQFTSLLEPIGATSLGSDVAVTTGVVAVASRLESSAGSGTFNHPIC